MVNKIAKEDRKSKEVLDPDHSINDLLLRGRVSAPATEKELPSGDKVVEFRLIISRTALGGARENGRGGVDTLDIAAWSAKSRRSALTLKAGQWIEVSGAIHRRFWQAPNGLASRWQVEAVEIVRI